MKLDAIRLFVFLPIAVWSNVVHNGFELPVEDSTITDTLVFAVKNINLQPASNFQISFSSSSSQSAYKQTEIINKFLVKANQHLIVRLDDIRSFKSVPTNKRKFTLLLVDSIESIQAIKPLLRAQVYKTDGKHLVLISESLQETEAMALIQNVFEIFYERYIINVELMVRNQTTGLVDFYTFFPVTPNYCFKIIPVRHNSFGGSQPVHRLNLFPRKFDNFFGCPLTVTTFNFPPHVFLWHENGKVKVRGIDILVLYGVAEKLNFSIKIIDSKVRGVQLENGTLTGALKLLKNCDANITLGGFGSSSKAMLQFSPSTSFIYTAMVFAIPPLREYSPLERLLLPFEYDVWIAIALTFGLTFIVSILMKTFSKRCRDLVFGDTVKSPVFEMIIVYLGGAVVRFPKGALARNVILQWLIVSLILSSCYKAILFGMLKTGFLKKFPSTITGMLDLGFVVDVPLPLMQNLKDGPLGGRDSFFLLKYSIHDHYAILQQGDSKRMVIDTRIQLDYFNSIYYESGVLSFLPQRLFLFPLYFYYPKNSYLVDPFDRILSKFKESGIITYWRYVVLNVSNVESSGTNTELKPLYLKDFQSCFSICAILLICSVVAFIVEIILMRKKTIRKSFLSSNSIEN